jgi:hypothetical protein
VCLYSVPIFTEEWPGLAVNQDEKVKQFIKDEGWGNAMLQYHALSCIAMLRFGINHSTVFATSNNVGRHPHKGY